ncbi:MAG: DUF2851 family protein [Gemmatimonadetes bacterium]|nr:DUF2851 family protein [Gemmatimonadota bacterium]
MLQIADSDIAEALIWHLWQNELSRTGRTGQSGRLRLTDGRTLRVHHPGTLNPDSGPDFLQAVLSFGPGKRLRGDVEIHIKPADWRRHGHTSDPLYNNVMLHVVLWHDEKLQAVRKQNGQYIPTLVLSEHFRHGLDRIRKEYRRKTEDPAPANYPCQNLMKRLSVERVHALLDRKGSDRFRKKAAEMSRRMKQVSAEQTLYEFAMRAAGYTKNTDACQALARRLPLATIRALIGTGGGLRIVDLQALLLGAAGLLPSQRLSYGGEVPDDPYVREIEMRWEAFRPSISTRPMKEHDWLFFRLRPFNFPTVRLAAMSYFIASGLRDGLDTLIAGPMNGGPMNGGADRGPIALLRQTARKLEEMIRPLPGDYWLKHTVFGETSRTARKALIGRDRQRGMMIDVILPFIYALADRDGQSDRMNLVREMYTGYGRQANNSVIQAMTNLLFIDTPEKKDSIDRAVLQQGLLQIDLETCRNKDCGQCVMNGTTRFTRS